MFDKQVVIDGRGHLLGRLASVIAKELLAGQQVVVVRCEQINIAGSLFRNHLKFQNYVHKRMNSNPSRGPYHQRAPSHMLFRVVRGMVPRKTKRGEAAMARLRCFEGVPPPYDTQKRKVIPEALRVLRLMPHRRFCVLNDLAKKVGWTKGELVERLEEKRKTRSKAFYDRKQERLAKLKKAQDSPALQNLRKSLAELGY